MTYKMVTTARDALKRRWDSSLRPSFHRLPLVDRHHLLELSISPALQAELLDGATSEGATALVVALAEQLRDNLEADEIMRQRRSHDEDAERRVQSRKKQEDAWARLRGPRNSTNP